MAQLPLKTVALVIGLALAAPVLAQPPGAPGAAPPAAPVVTKNPANAPAGAYNLDINHASIIARVPHNAGVSFSTMRFGVTKGSLTWDPANPANIKLDVTADSKPHYDPIKYGLGPESERILNSAKFPEITFVSTGVRRSGATGADVDGTLTLMGVSKPATIHAELVGVSKTQQGKAAIGFTGTMMVKRGDFGLNFLMGMIGNDVTIVLDGEFLGG